MGKSFLKMALTLEGMGFKRSYRYIPTLRGSVIRDEESLIDSDRPGRHEEEGYHGHVYPIGSEGATKEATVIRNVAFLRSSSKYQRRGNR